MLKTFTTPAGKEIRMKYTPHGAITLCFYPGGELPEELSGLFTSSTEAEKAVTIYLGGKEKSDAPKQTRKAT